MVRTIGLESFSIFILDCWSIINSIVNDDILNLRWLWLCSGARRLHCLAHFSGYTLAFWLDQQKCFKWSHRWYHCLIRYVLFLTALTLSVLRFRWLIMLCFLWYLDSTNTKPDSIDLPVLRGLAATWPYGAHLREAWIHPD